MAVTGNRGVGRQLAVAILVVVSLSVEAYHYRGGTVRWKFLRYDPMDNQRAQIAVAHRITWLNEEVVVCSAESLNKRFGGGDMNCFTVGSSLTCPLSLIDNARYYNCSDYNPEIPWSSGTYSVDVVESFPIGNPDPYILGYRGCCWGDDVPANGESSPNPQFGLFSSMILVPRSDNGAINNAPITSMFPEVPVQRGCVTNLRIPIVDEDGDFVSCREGTDGNSLIDSCFSICSPVDITFNPSGDQASCSIQVPQITNSRNFYGVPLVIEDRLNVNDNQPLSTVPLSFVLRLYGDSQTCLDEPTFVGSTPAYGSEVAAMGSGASGQIDIVARSTASDLTITQIVTLSPSRTTKTALTTVENTGGRESTISVTFDRAPGQTSGREIMCFYAVQSNGVASSPHCITVSYEGGPVEDPCNSDPCTNGGSCMAIQNNADYECKCPVGYSGKTCDTVTCTKRCFTDVPVEGCYCDQACVYLNDCCDDFNSICMHDDANQPGLATCAGRCYTEGSVGDCYCDQVCPYWGDCCTDFYTRCPRPPEDDLPGEGSCADRCYTYGSQDGCYCDWACNFFSDCCSDFNNQCVRELVNAPGEPTCANRCFSPGEQGGCYCDTLCRDFNDCCNDYFELCPRFEGDPCQPSLCQNGGNCQPSNDNNDYRCTCSDDFMGKNCQNENPCLQTPCMQDAPCTPQNENTDYSCDCPDNYLGKNCSNENPCLQTPCMQDAPCTPLEENTDYSCDCPDNYMGKNCETVNPCLAPSPCENDGVCTPEGDYSDYDCECTDGFVGKNCQIVVPVEPCTIADICQNGGTCMPLGEFNYSCNCVPGFLGDNCEDEYECAEGSSYAECITICQRRTCQQPDGPPGCDSTDCVEGCLCHDGHLLEDDVCIPASECGCEKDGMYYMLNTVLVDENCTEECTCMSPNNFECSSLDCSQDSSCQQGENGYRCMCNEGFRGNGFVCTPVDEECRGFDDQEICLGPECSRGCFKSPNYPDQHYQPNTIIQYIVQVPGTEYYTFQCKELFDIEDDRDALYVGPGQPPLVTELELDPSLPVRLLDGDEAPGRIVVESSAFWMYFLTDRIEQRRGWECCWKADDPCVDNPCQNGGRCESKDANSVVCVCVGGFTGTNCEQGRAHCRARGDPHYTTFDGRKYDFQGACRYYLLKTCGNETAPFHIIQKNRKLSTNSRAAVTQDLLIHFYGYEIGLLPEKKLTIDGMVRFPPLEYPGFTVTRSGNKLVLNFNNSLEVQWDGRYGVDVWLSYEFSGRTCGLCGNMDMERNNEFVGPGFVELDGPVAFGNSWKVSQDCNANDESSGVHPCVELGIDPNEDEFLVQILDVLTDLEGPFAECHDLADPLFVVEDANYDWCSSKPDKSSACDNVASYASMCQENGIEVGVWRAADFCPMMCPANSEYEPCMTACPNMCGVNRTDDFVCDLPCVEGCECTEGHILDGDGSCVLVDECGCFYEDIYRPASVDTFLSEDCTSTCTCTDGQPVCQAFNCDAGTKFCGVDDDGVRGCYCNPGTLPVDGGGCMNDPCAPNPCNNRGRCKRDGSDYNCECVRGFEGRNCDDFRGHCYAHGDPHYRSFDGVKFDYQGGCKYILVELCNAEGFTPFRIIQENEKLRPNGKGPAVTKAIYFEALGGVFALKRNRKFYIDGVERRPPVNLGDVVVTRQGKYLVLEFEPGVSVRWNGRYDVDISIASDYFNNTCGLCGNWNGNSDDEFDGFDNPEAYGNRWALDGQECESNEEPTPFQCNSDPSVLPLVQEICGIFHADAFSSCAGLDLADGFAEDCVFDLCATFPDQTNFCSSVALYADLCQESGFEVDGWRSPQVCPMECPEHSHYSACSSPCPATCGLSADICQQSGPCIEACECDEGYVLQGDDCVKPEQCGCLVGFFYYKIGENFPNSGCSEWCTCVDQEAECENRECHSDARCAFRGLRLGCDCNEGYLGDGYSCQQDPCQTGEEHCSGNGRCVSDGEGGFDCECRRGWSGENCDMGMAICSGHGDPHYTSFDGRRFDFQGDCWYTLLRVFVESLNDTVEVVADNKRYSMNSRVSLTRELLVIVGDSRIELLQDKKVEVNGLEVNTPYTVLPGVSIRRAGKQLVVETPFGLKVEWDGRNTFSIEVSAEYFNRTEGLCGPYDDERDNDFRTPGGEVVPDENSFGNSWVYGDCGTMEPPGDSYNPCNDNPMFDQAHEHCSILSDADSPLRACYEVIDAQSYYDSCLYDLCSTLPQLGALCEDVAKYADDCHWAGVDIEDWRSEEFCPFNCPEGSVYTMCAPGCPVTCTDIIEDSNDTACTQPCREGCQCEEGKVLSGDQCVSPDDCGCLTDDWMYLMDGEDILSSDCQERCTCVDQALECNPTSCHENADCVLDDGENQCRCREPLIGDGFEQCNFNPCELKPCQNFGICHPVGNSDYWCECTDKWTGKDCDIRQGACYGFGTQHYFTFDTTAFTFRGECKYTLTETCPESVEPSFKIIQENMRLSSSSSGVKALHVYLNNHTFTLGPRHTVKFDDMEVTLPFSDDDVEVRFRGLDVVLRTSIGLEVAFDGWYGFKVLIGNQYATKMCGLCGNFDGDFLNDVAIDGERVLSTMFGNSQLVNADCLVPDEPHPADLPNPCDTLTPEQRSEAEDFCEGLTEGEFAECGEMFGNQTAIFVEKCTFDVCASRLNQQVSCSHPKYFAEICRNYGSQIGPWRRVDYCPLACPEWSEYNPRASPCPKTCVDDINDIIPECEHTRRVEACECNEGYVLSGTECVAREECGCFSEHTGSYHENGQVFLIDDCTRRCVCLLGSVSCSPVSCHENAECTLSDGQHMCKCNEGYMGDGMEECQETACISEVCANNGTCMPGPNNTYSCLCPWQFSGENCEEGVRSCSFYGTTRYVTFSLFSYDFAGAGSYFLTRTCNESADSSFEVVQKKMRLLDNPGIAINEEIWIRFQDMEIILNTDREISMNGMEILPPYSNDMVRISLRHNRMIVSTPFGLTVEWDGVHFISTSLTTDWAERVCGLCGDMGGPVDLKILSADSPTAIADFGEMNSACQVDCPPPIPPLTSECSMDEEAEVTPLCQPIVDERGPFRRCPIELRSAAYQSCIQDACALFHDKTTPICEAFSAVAKLCQQMLTEVDPWRVDAGCSVPCPENAVFKECASACQRSCGDPAEPDGECPLPCEEGCECEEGYVVDHSGRCIQPEDCGCFDEDLYHMHGEEYYRQGCSELCHCEDGEPVCEEVECHVNGTCGVNDGDYGCYCDEGYMGNGTQCKVNPCHPGLCENDGICAVVEGEGEEPATYKCFCQGLWKGQLCEEGLSSCSVSGHTHYDRFDGEVFNFHGNCSYILAQACGEAQNVFQVVLENEPDEDLPGMSRIEAVHINLREQSIVLKEELMLIVNGKERLYPFIQPGFEIKQYGWIVKVSTDFGLVVAWNGQDLVDITFSSDFTDGVCGICGSVSDPTPGFGDHGNANEYATAWLHNPEECPKPQGYLETCENKSCNLREAVQHCSMLLSPNVACPAGWLPLAAEGNSPICYYLDEIEEGLTFAAADHKCKSLGGRLYDPVTELEAESFRNATEGRIDGPYWLGCTDEGHDSWTCEHESHFWSRIFVTGDWAWDEDQPDDGGSEFLSENCALIYGDKWRDVSCKARAFHLVCQLESHRAFLTPFKECHEVVSPHPYFDNCIQNQCASLPEEGRLCSSLAAYENVCLLNGAEVGPWRSLDFCPLECPADTYLSECVSPCPPTCAEPDRSCPLPCRPGCQCREGSVRQGSRCIPKEECGCFMASLGLFIKPGDSVFNPDCEELCTCLPGGMLDCRDGNCTENATCVAHENGPGFDCQCDEGFVYMDEGCQPDACAGVECANGGQCVPLHEDYSCFCPRGWAGKHCEEEKGECEVQGLSHYLSFDGQPFNFFGDCVTLLAGHCGKDVEEPLFMIQEKKERNLLQREVASLSYLKIILDDVTIKFHQDLVVMMNGIRRNLPIIREGLSVKLVGSRVLLQTSFGLRVSWDGHSAVKIVLPEMFKNQTCGLCGNFDGDTENDLVPKDGDEVGSAAEFGNSWAYDDEHCEPDDGNLAQEFFMQSCGDRFESVQAYCHGVLMQHLLEPCGDEEFLGFYISGCVHDVCLLHGLHYGCSYAASAVAACRAQGGRPPPRETLPEPCRVECPANSEYSPCMSYCPHTCDNVHGEEREPCEDKPCVEGCQCKEGYVLSGLHCVPADMKCGCREGAFYLDGEEFVREGCLEKCECEDGRISCEPIDCHCDTKCKADKYGYYGCQCEHPYVGDGDICTVDPCYSNPCTNHGKCTVSADFSYVCVCPPQWTGVNCEREQKECSVYGSPQHFSTFDGANFNFFGTCVYLLAGDCSADPLFLVSIQGEPTEGRPGLTKVKEVWVFVRNGLNFGLHQHKQLTVDYRPVSLPFSNEGVDIVPGQHMILTTPFGLTVRWNGYYEVDVWLDTELLDNITLCGLCGNADGDPTNILDETPDGQRVISSVDFGNSWRLPFGCLDNDLQGNDLQDACNGDIARAAATLTCQIIVDENGPFGECIGILDPAPYLENCIFTACSSGDPEDRSNICSSLLTLESACLDRWLPVGFWRAPGFCEPPCQDDLEFQPSAPACPKTCLGVILEKSVPCPFPYQAGCVCDPHLYVSGDKCVTKDECGCYYQGLYHELHEVFLSRDCERNCTCYPGNRVECEDNACSIATYCGVKDGQFGCHCVPGYEDNGCGECRANPCEPNPCQQNSTCIIIEQHDYQCECPPGYGGKNCEAALARCTVSGDPHIETFDGVRYHFGGVCENILLHNCFETDVHKFTVTQVTERSAENPNIVDTTMITIYSENNYHLEIHRGFILLINGIRVIPPLIEPRQQIYLSGSWMFLVDHDLDLVMRYDGKNHVDLFVHSKLGQVCGLCGFYDGDPTNDFLTQTGEFTSDPVEFGNSWFLPNSTCEEATAVPNGCDGDSGDNVAADNACNAIRDVVGSLSACHDVIPYEPYYEKCVFDICKSLPDTSARCAHIQDYAQRCINAGVNVGYQWRMERDCFLECPEHSHFSSCIESCPPSCLGAYVYEDPRRCVQYCNDGCVCDEGYYLSDDHCVAKEECGCLVPHSLLHLTVLPVGFSYMTGGCQEFCECGANGTVTCQSVSCHNDATCQVDNGIERCVCNDNLVGDGLECMGNPCVSNPCSNSGTCQVAEDLTYVCVCPLGWTGLTCTEETRYCVTYGDPHYRTFDGTYYDFMGQCSYYLVTTCGFLGSTNIIQVNEQIPFTQYTVMKELLIQYSNQVLHLVPDVGVLLDDVLQTPPFTFANNMARVRQVGTYIVVEMDFFVVRWDGRYNAYIEKLADYSGQNLCGLCGDGFGDPSDDFSDGDPATADDATTFGNRQTDPNRPCSGDASEQPNLCSGNEDTEFADALCRPLDMNLGARAQVHRRPTSAEVLFNGQPLNRTSPVTSSIGTNNSLTCAQDPPIRYGFPFQSCTDMAATFHEACRYDICAIVTGDLSDAVPIACGVIATYAQLCQDLGHTIGDWRSGTDCSTTCPRHAEYSQCADPCKPTCRDPNGDIPCISRCAQGCSCEEGYYQEGDECVSRSQCGCLYNDAANYLKLNDDYYTDTCTMRCTCPDAFGEVVCAPATCHENATCETVNGIQKCVCAEGFVGDGQDCDFAECAEDPCPESTQCLRRQDGNSDYVCECQDNFLMGKNCDVPADYNNRFACYGSSCDVTAFSSLNYPELYPSSHKAFYQAWVPGAKYFSVNFPEPFQVETDKDFLYIGSGFQYPLGLNDGPLSTVPGLFYQLSGYTPPGDIFIEGDAVWLYFVTDDQVDARGWTVTLDAEFTDLQGTPLCWDGSQTRLSSTVWDYGKCDECTCAAGAAITCSLNATKPISCESNNDCPSTSACVPADQVPLCPAEPCSNMYCDVATIYANCNENPNCAEVTVSANVASLLPAASVTSLCQSLLTAAEMTTVSNCFFFECAVRRDARKKRAASDETVLIDIFLESGSPPTTSPTAPVSEDGMAPVDTLALTLYERLSGHISDGSLPINITDVIYLGPRPITKAPPTSSSEKVTVKKVTAGPVDPGMPMSTIAAIASGSAAITLLMALTLAIWCRYHGRRSSKKTMTFQESSQEAHANEAFEMVDHGPAFSRAIPLDDGTGHQSNVYGVKYDLEM